MARRAAIARERQPVKEILVGRKSCGMVDGRIVNNEFSIAAHWPGGFDEPACGSGRRICARNYSRPRFHSASFHVAEIFPGLPNRALEMFAAFTPGFRWLAGCSSTRLIAGTQEIDKTRPDWVLALYSLPGAELKDLSVSCEEQVEEARRPGYWHCGRPGVEPGRAQMAGSFSLTRPSRTRESWIRS